MSFPKVTVLMPIYNSERYVRYALESILDQRYIDFELLIIDDCSTDGSAEVLQSYDDSRIRIMTNAQNIGLTRSLNKGLRYARGEYVARLDSDDIALPMRLQKQATYLDQHPEVGLVATGVELIDERGRATGSHVPHLSSERIYHFLIFYNCIFHSSVMFRLEVAKNLGGYDEAFELAEDADLWYRISRISRIAMCDEILTKLRDHPSSISNKHKIEQDRVALQIYARNLVDLMQQPVDLKKLICFHNEGFVARRPLVINAESLVELTEVYKRIITTCPPFLNRASLKRYQNLKLLYYVTFLLWHKQFKDLLKISYDASFRTLFFDLVKQNFLRIGVNR
jgi:glycosyltransferase involved in cell wall biosynthesis